MSDRQPSEFEDVYFGMLAEMDFTKHLGGQQATDELIQLCHIGADSYVLDVGCGVGISEFTWIKEPTPELRTQVTQSFGGNLDVQSSEEWQALLEAGGLKDVVAKTNEITIKSEFSNRIKRLGGVKGMARLWAKIKLVGIWALRGAEAGWSIGSKSRRVGQCR